MRKLALFAVILAGVAAVQFLATCSNPLEPSDVLDDGQPNPGPGDTVIIYDTVTVEDTVITTDTLFIVDSNATTDTIIVIDTTMVTDTLIVIDTQLVVDTVFIYDTTTIHDTIIVVVPDSTGPFVYCSRLGSSQQEVVWMFRNSAGPYHLEISASAERLKPEPQMIVTVDGMRYDWNLAEGLELILDQTLSENATIVIERAKPNPFGHALDFCIYIEREDE